MPRLTVPVLRRIVLPAAAALSLLAGSVAPAAQAAAPAAASPVATAAVVQPAAHVVTAKKKVVPVTVKKIANKKVKGSAKATVRPSYSRLKGARIASARLTVAHGKRYVAKNRTSVKLAAGTYRVTTTVRYRYTGWKAVHSAKRTQTLKVTKVAAKSWVWGSGRNCPKAYPVKGNQSGIYHVPGGRYYKITTPEQCFKNAAAARKAGYRASRNG